MDPAKQGQLPKNAATLQSVRLLHVEASGAEVAIPHDMVEHVAYYAEVAQLKESTSVLRRVGVFKGTILPIIDIRGTQLECNEHPFHDFLVLRLRGELIGARVDRAIEILTVAAAAIESLGFRSDVGAEFITGMLSLPNKRLPIVDMNRLLYPQRATA